MNNIFAEQNRKNLISALVLGLAVLGIPLTVMLVQQQQILRSRANTEFIKFVGTNVEMVDNGNRQIATSENIEIEVIAPGNVTPPKARSPQATLLNITPANPGDNDVVTVRFSKNADTNWVNLIVDASDPAAQLAGQKWGETVYRAGDTPGVIQVGPLSSCPSGGCPIVWPVSHPRHTTGTHRLGIYPYYCDPSDTARASCTPGAPDEGESFQIGTGGGATPTPAGGGGGGAPTLSGTPSVSPASVAVGGQVTFTATGTNTSRIGIAIFYNQQTQNPPPSDIAGVTGCNTPSATNCGLNWTVPANTPPGTHNIRFVPINGAVTGTAREVVLTVTGSGGGGALTASCGSGNRASLRWPMVNGAENYIVRVNEDPPSWNPHWAGTDLNDATDGDRSYSASAAAPNCTGGFCTSNVKLSNGVFLDWSVTPGINGQEQVSSKATGPGFTCSSSASNGGLGQIWDQVKGLVQTDVVLASHPGTPSVDYCAVHGQPFNGTVCTTCPGGKDFDPATKTCLFPTQSAAGACSTSSNLTCGRSCDADRCCGTGLTCFGGECRLTSNLQSPTCDQPAVTPATSTAPTSAVPTSGGQLPAGAVITQYKIGETDTPTAWINVTPQTYTAGGRNASNYTFIARPCVTQPCDTYPREVRTVFVQFIGTLDGKPYTNVQQAQITLAKTPVINSVLCESSPTGTGSIVTVNGSHFGTDVGSVQLKEPTQNAQNLTVAATGAWSNLQVAGTTSNILSGATDVTVRTVDGKPSNIVACTPNKSQLDFKASLACRTVDKALSTADIEIKDASSSAVIFPKQKVTFSTDGRPQGLLPQLTEGKDYKISIKAPGSLTKVINFKAAKGTTSIQALKVPLGDIYPQAPDCTINSLDRSEMIRQWSAAKDATNKSANLNGDSAVNSIDYACLVSNFNKTCDAP